MRCSGAIIMTDEEYVRLVNDSSEYYKAMQFIDKRIMIYENLIDCENEQLRKMDNPIYVHNAEIRKHEHQLKIDVLIELRYAIEKQKENKNESRTIESSRIKKIRE